MHRFTGKKAAPAYWETRAKAKYQPPSAIFNVSPGNGMRPSGPTTICLCVVEARCRGRAAAPTLGTPCRPRSIRRRTRAASQDPPGPTGAAPPPASRDPPTFSTFVTPTDACTAASSLYPSAPRAARPKEGDRQRAAWPWHEKEGRDRRGRGAGAPTARVARGSLAAPACRG